MDPINDEIVLDNPKTETEEAPVVSADPEAARVVPDEAPACEPVVETAAEAPAAEAAPEAPTEEPAPAPEAASEPAKETAGASPEVLSALTALTEKVEQLSKQFDAKIMHTTHEEKIVDQMHAELQKYKEDMYSQLVRPILLDIIDMRDSIIRMSQTYAAKPEGEQSIPLKTFSDYSYDMQDILEKNNITVYKSAEGDAFTPIRQRVIKKVPTPVEELHGKIAESLSDGYEYLGKTISPEKITVYVYEQNNENKGEQN